MQKLSSLLWVLFDSSELLSLPSLVQLLFFQILFLVSICIYNVYIFFQDPKRKVHKPVKGVLRLELEKFRANHTYLDNLSEAGSATNSLNDVGESVGPSGKHPNDGSDGHQNGSLKLNGVDRKKQHNSDLQITRGCDLHNCSDEVVSAGFISVVKSLI